MFKAIDLKQILKAITLVIVIAILFVSIGFLIKNMMFKIDFEDIVINASIKYDIDKNVILAVIKAESNFNKDAVSNKNAKGLMQLLDSTANEIVNRSRDYPKDQTIDLYNPSINIDIGCKYLSTLLKKYDNNVPLALAAYNGGMGNVDSWLKNGIISKDNVDSLDKIPFSETNNYVKKVLRYSNVYKTLYK